MDIKLLGLLLSNKGSNGGSNGDVKVSWNDLTDKPFYAQYGEAVDLGSWTNLQPNPEGMFIIADNPPELIADYHYIVSWNGVEYPCNCVDLSQVEETFSGMVLGNAAALGAPVENTNEPFCILYVSGEEIFLAAVPLDGTGILDLALSGQEIIYHKIDKEFIPRGQKNIIVDLGKQTTNVDLSVALQMDMAELKGAITVIGIDGKEADVISVQKENITFDGQEYQQLDILVRDDTNSSTHAGFTVYKWKYKKQVIPGGFNYRLDFVKRPELFRNSSNRLMRLYVAYFDTSGDIITDWRTSDTVSFSNIILRSTESDKLFNITVNDAGELTATEIHNPGNIVL